MLVPQALMAIDLDLDLEDKATMSGIVVEDPKGCARLRSRPRSYHHILEDFSFDDPDKEGTQVWGREKFDVVSVLLEEREGEDSGEGDVTGRRLSSSPRKENTARRIKRFSLPAVAVQTTTVTARTETADVEHMGGPDGMKINNRFSLVLGGRHGRGRSGGGRHHDAEGETDGQEDGKGAEKESRTSVAACRLS